MTNAAADRRDNPETLFATPEIVADRRADGSIWLKSTTPLQQDARCVGDWLERWARQGRLSDTKREGWLRSAIAGCAPETRNPTPIEASGVPL